MQMLMSFVQQLLNPAEPSPDVWATLDVQQRNETLAVLARLLARTAAESTRANTTDEQGGQDDE